MDRMFKRVITFAGAPVLTGILLFPLFWYLRVGGRSHNQAAALLLSYIAHLLNGLVVSRSG